MGNTIIDGLRERISNAMSVNQSVGIMLPGNNYSDLTQALFEFMNSKPKTAWVYVTITNPYGSIVKKFGDKLQSWAGDVRIFRGFDEIIDKILENLDESDPKEILNKFDKNFISKKLGK